MIKNYKILFRSDRIYERITYILNERKWSVCLNNDKIIARLIYKHLDLESKETEIRANMAEAEIAVDFDISKYINLTSIEKDLEDGFSLDCIITRNPYSTFRTLEVKLVKKDELC